MAFETFAILHDIPTATWPRERKKFSSKGQPHLRSRRFAPVARNGSLRHFLVTENPGARVGRLTTEAGAARLLCDARRHALGAKTRRRSVKSLCGAQKNRQLPDAAVSLLAASFSPSVNALKRRVTMHTALIYEVQKAVTEEKLAEAARSRQTPRPPSRRRSRPHRRRSARVFAGVLRPSPR